MAKRGIALWLLAPVVLLIACANRQPASRFDARLQHRGFSAARPPHDQWFLLLSEQSPPNLLFRRTVAGSAHSFLFEAQLASIEGAPASDVDFAAFVEKRMTAIRDTDRFSLLSYQGQLAPRQGQVCVRYAMETLDRENPLFPGVELRTSFKGVACRHPAWPDTILDWRYSERAPASELDPSLAAEGDALIEGIVIETAPGVPAR